MRVACFGKLVCGPTRSGAVPLLRDRSPHAKPIAVDQVPGLARRVDEDTILWQTTIEDPEIYNAPWTVEIPLVSRRGTKIYEYACHEGNQAVGNILRGARVQEALLTEN